MQSGCNISYFHISVLINKTKQQDVFKIFLRSRRDGKTFMEAVKGAGCLEFLIVD